MKKLNILSLHRMGDPRFRRKAVVDLEYFMPHHFPDHNHIVHDASLVPPWYLKNINWDATLLGSTFLCKVLHSDELISAYHDYEWIKESKALKFAFPQDDYDNSELLDQWMCDWLVDVVYTVLYDHAEILYPKYKKIGEIKEGYTGFISEDMKKKWSQTKPHDQRMIDVSYRATKFNAYYGNLGHIKGVIGERFEKAAQDYGLNMDISTNQADMIPGEKWHEFLENSKFCLATPSGSNILDKKGKIKLKIKEFLSMNPDSSFDEISRNCFGDQMGKYNFTAISPRNIEAALAETVQIAVPGQYSNIMIPYEDYIPLEEDCSNIDEVIEIMNDREKVEDIAKNIKDKILNNLKLSMSHHANEIMKQIIENQKKDKQSSSVLDNKYFRKYRRFETFRVKIYWMKYYIREYLKKILKSIGLFKFFKGLNK